MYVSKTLEMVYTYSTNIRLFFSLSKFDTSYQLDSDGDLPVIVQETGTVPNEDTTTATVALAESDDSDQFAFPDPDWQAIASHSPAKDDVPLFLDSRQRRHDAEIKFEAALDTAFEALRFCTETLLRVAAEVSNGTLERLNVMETNIKEILVENDQVRNDMNHKLQQFAVQAQKQFEELMSRLANSKS
jgi:hypothetical protein